MKTKSGQRYGRLVAIELHHRTRHRDQYWSFQCNCGNIKVASIKKVRSGNTQSCGCFRREKTAALGKSLITHGLCKSPEYVSWVAMKRRCGNPANDDFNRYGGRGIKVCERWMMFENFFADMGPRLSPNHSIDRINNNGNYEPGNCRWATAKEQAHNRRNNRFVEYKGRRITMANAAELAGIKVNTMWRRISVHGWEAERAIDTPLRRGRSTWATG